jgi:hypothetical protein
MIIEISLNEINTEKELNKTLDEQFWFSKEMSKYWMNFSAFWDMYSYGNDNDTIIIKWFSNVSDSAFIEIMGKFLFLLHRLKFTNPNFDFKIES